MFNVDALTKTLSAMPLPQLQQYASMHKNDPYVVSMALSIANQKKQMQVAQDGAAGQQQQPKVADQAIAGMVPQEAAQHMLPEEQGIGALPAPNMQHMAEGGIIGNEGEEQQAGAFDFRSENEPVVRMAGGGMVSFAGGGDVPQMFNQLPAGSYGAPQAGAPENQPWAQRKMDEIAAKVRAGTASPQEKAWVSMFGGDALNRVSARETQSSYQNAPDQLGGENARMAAQAKAATAPTQAPLQNPPALPQVQTAAPTPPTPTQPTVATGIGTPPSVNSAIEQYKKQMVAPETAPDKEAFMKEHAAPSEELYADLAKRMAESSERMKSDKQESAYMAMIKGGLAAAAGASPFGLTNLAKGMESGAADYSEALKEFRKAAADQSKMEIDLARAKAADKRGDMDAYQKAMDSYANRQEKRDDRQAAGIQAIVVQDMQNKGSANVAGIHAASNLATANIHANTSLKTADMYRAPALVENIRKNIESSLQKQNYSIGDPAAFDAEVQRRLNIELQKNPNLAQYATTTQGSSTPSPSGWGQATVKPSK